LPDPVLSLSAAGAVFTFFGLMHGEQVGITPHPEVAIRYLMVAIFLAACARWAPPQVKTQTEESH
jgi:AGZA family xanthine/uracil permease-like MFS transporter